MPGGVFVMSPCALLRTGGPCGPRETWGRLAAPFRLPDIPNLKLCSSQDGRGSEFVSFLSYTSFQLMGLLKPCRWSTLNSVLSWLLWLICLLTLLPSWSDFSIFCFFHFNIFKHFVNALSLPVPFVLAAFLAFSPWSGVAGGYPKGYPKSFAHCCCTSFFSEVLGGSREEHWFRFIFIRRLSSSKWLGHYVHIVG